MFVNQAEKIASYVGFDTLTERRVKPNDAALPIFAWLLWCQFLPCSLVCDRNYCDVVYFDKEEQSPEMFKRPSKLFFKKFSCLRQVVAYVVVFTFKRIFFDE